MKRKTDLIVIHCTGASKKQTVASILRHWKETMGWKKVGYHRLIEPNGTVHKLADFNETTNGAKGYNHRSIHICYIGGQHVDDRTEEQKAAIIDCIYEALKWVDNPQNMEILGHRELPDVRKNCPQYSAKKEYSWITA